MKNNSFMKMLKGNSGIIAVLVIISVILSFASPVFLTTDNLLSVLRQVSNNMYLALGMTLVIILGGIDLSVGTCVAMCGTLTAGLMVNQGMPMVPAIAVGLLLGTLAGFLNGLIIATFKVPAFIVTMSMMNVAKGVAYIYSGGRSIRVSNDVFTGIGTGKLFGVLPLPVVYMIVLIILFTTLSLPFWVSIITASTIIKPFTTSCQKELSPIRFRPLLIIPITRAPNMVPDTAPTPPVIDMPPKTQAAMASSSYPSPTPGCPEIGRAHV